MLKTLAIGVSLSLLLVGMAAAGKDQPGTTPQAPGGQPPPLAIKKPDLVCEVAGYETKNLFGLIPNGGSVLYSGGGVPTVWISFRVENKGLAKAKNFSVRIVVKRNGSTVKDVQLQGYSTVDPGQGSGWWGPSAVGVDLPSVTNKIEAKVIVDPTNTIAELNEGNNTCTTTFTATVAG